MKIEVSDIKIMLDKDELLDFWNIIRFAVDYHCERKKNGLPCMNVSEEELARELIDITDKMVF